jgi:2,3-dihydroxyphenylpropionate 1,2-dioxygenase
MSPNTHLLCAVHSPLLYCHARKPERWDDIERVFAERKQAVAAFDPELVVAFGSDHFNGFFLNLMPAFCVGASAQGTADIGGFAGEVLVPKDTAFALVEYLREHDVDAAMSYRMKIDHAFTQLLTRVLNGMATRPILPIFINCITVPFVPFRRTRMLGEAVGRFAAGLGKRVLFLASGGMSHHPTPYYPPYGTGPAPVTAWQRSGGTEVGSLSEPEWLKRLEQLHVEAAEMIVRGERTAADMRLNEVIDRRFLDGLASGNLTAFDTWEPNQTIADAGVGFMELHTWIAATAAHLAAGGRAPVADLYAQTPELGVASGIVHGE